MNAGFQVQRRRCATCIYRKTSPLDINKLEAEVTDKHGFFNGYRVCHHSAKACCYGFWKLHKDEFASGQIAQRLGLVNFVHHDILT